MNAGFFVGTLFVLINPREYVKYCPLSRVRSSDKWGHFKNSTCPELRDLLADKCSLDGLNGNWVRSKISHYKLSITFQLLKMRLIATGFGNWKGCGDNLLLSICIRTRSLCNFSKQTKYQPSILDNILVE